MTIRKKLFALMVGIIIFPFMATGFTFFIWYQFGQTAEILELERVLEWVYKDFIPTVRKGSAPPPSPQSLPFVFFSPDNVVLLSSIDDFPAGTRFEPREAAAYISVLTKRNEHGIIFTEKISNNGQDRGTLIAGIKFSEAVVDLVDWRDYIAAFYLFLAIALGTVLGGVVIFRNMGRSVVALEKAAKEIAAGNYDFEIVPRGKDEFTSLTNSFEIMRKTIKENSAQRSRFLMAVSHDLKTPLTSIHGYLEAL
jgi:signal transduction histidine kinase